MQAHGDDLVLIWRRRALIWNGKRPASQGNTIHSFQPPTHIQQPNNPPTHRAIHFGRPTVCVICYIYYTFQFFFHFIYYFFSFCYHCCCNVFDLNGFGYPALTLCPLPRRKLNFSLGSQKHFMHLWRPVNQPTQAPTHPIHPASNDPRQLQAGFPLFLGNDFFGSDQAQFLLRLYFILASFLVTQLFGFSFFRLYGIFFYSELLRGSWKAGKPARVAEGQLQQQHVAGVNVAIRFEFGSGCLCVCYCCHDFHIFHKSGKIANLCSKFVQMRKYLVRASVGFLANQLFHYWIYCFLFIKLDFQMGFSSSTELRFILYLSHIYFFYFFVV